MGTYYISWNTSSIPHNPQNVADFCCFEKKMLRFLLQRHILICRLCRALCKIKKFCGHLSCKIQRSMTSRKWQLSWNLKWSCDLAQVLFFSAFFSFWEEASIKVLLLLRLFVDFQCYQLIIGMILEKIVGFWVYKRKVKRAKLFDKVNYLLMFHEIGKSWWHFIFVRWVGWVIKYYKRNLLAPMPCNVMLFLDLKKLLLLSYC